MLICGLPGVGKTTLARDLASLLDAVLLSSDKIRKQLIQRPTYRKQERILIYDILTLIAKYLHNAGINCVLDATFNTERLRRKFRKDLSLTWEQISIVECTCPETIVVSRLRQRKNDYSDADISIYRKMKGIYERVRGQRIIVDTSQQASKQIAKKIADELLLRMSMSKK